MSWPTLNGRLSSSMMTRQKQHIAVTWTFLSCMTIFGKNRKNNSTIKRWRSAKRTAQKLSLSWRQLINGLLGSGVSAAVCWEHFCRSIYKFLSQMKVLHYALESTCRRCLPKKHLKTPRLQKRAFEYLKSAICISKALANYGKCFFFFFKKTTLKEN